MLRWLPENVSTYGPDIDRLFYVIYYVTGATFFVVQIALLVFIVLYRHRDGRRATYTHGNTSLEIAWTIAPAILLVIHSFFVPSARFKQDAVPGHSIPTWFKIIRTGNYEIPCAELCGFGHSGMRGWLYVQTPEEYEAWARENKVGPLLTAPALGN